jgi:hypothetical protein
MCALATFGFACANPGVKASNNEIAMRNFMKQKPFCDLPLYDARNPEADSNIEATSSPKTAASPTTFGDGCSIAENSLAVT